ncbi:conserved hypothetical protein [Pediculus humanus corporis]|uniref:Major facilitator superfamily (MFS) profile domain-containing protein n=1 Tax=Pediculus humanus subsp. corporis TaxID=121224 RepID=E0VCU5_PEDHC|nr:uncharacterized protein Phum_PHUM097480 [Pediculus humanus corporis]EEB11201.1 conserved hypothetical protein [Pediculus humanus corporis]
MSEGEPKKINSITKSQWLTVLILCYVNLINYMDRYTVAGIGEASYSTIAPTIISDLFVKDLRAKMLALFYFAIPVGSGLGYIVGSETARMAGSWHWALRVTPVMGLIAVILICFFVKDPERGESEGQSHLAVTSWGEDIRNIIRNRSFMFSTIGFMCVSFVTGALAWWGPDFIYRGVKLQPGNENVQLNDIAFTFGVITMISGLVGVPLGQMLACKIKIKYPKADPLICGFGLLFSAPLLFAASLLPTVNTFWCFFFIFFGELSLNLNWSIVADMLLYVIIPTRRSTAEAFQILVSHAFGDAGSPYFIGALSRLSTVLMNMKRHHSAVKRIVLPTIFGQAIHQVIIPMLKNGVLYYSLQYSLFTTSFVEVIGGIFFLVTAAYIIKDKLTAEREVRGEKTYYLDKISKKKGEMIKLGTENQLTDEKQFTKSFIGQSVSQSVSQSVR